MGIKIITDSACDLTKEYIESENIGLVSLILNLNGKLIKDDLGKTLTYKEFYTEMRKGATPTTSQINSYDFEEEFIKHIEDFKKAAPYYTEEDIVAILDEEQDKKIRPSFWNRPWM